MKRDYPGCQRLKPLKQCRVTWERPCEAVSGGGDPNRIQKLVELRRDCFSCLSGYMWGAWGEGFHQSTALFSATKQQASPVRELVSDVGRACSVEVEALLHGGSEEALSHDLFGGIFRQLQVVHTRVNWRVAGICCINLEEKRQQRVRTETETVLALLNGILMAGF